MLKIKDNVDLKELEKLGFYLEGNTYKYDIGKGKCLAVCIINREIIEPKLPVYTSRLKAFFHSSKPYKKLSGIMFELEKANLVEKVEE